MLLAGEWGWASSQRKIGNARKVGNKEEETEFGLKHLEFQFILRYGNVQLTAGNPDLESKKVEIEEMIATWKNLNSYQERQCEKRRTESKKFNPERQQHWRSFGRSSQRDKKNIMRENHPTI